MSGSISIVIGVVVALVGSGGIVFVADGRRADQKHAGVAHG
ncbi:MAG: hypothetical protein WKF96_22070 [Solirubrobacteraceae bacterium]